jgi:TonB-linked SusC/RagA family outer membrane protein
MNKPRPIQDVLPFIMKITVIQFLLMVILTSLVSAASLKGQSILDRKVSIDAENREIKSILSDIERQTSVVFTYRPRLIQASKKITFRVKDTRLEDVLQQLFSPEISYLAVDEEEEIVLRFNSHLASSGPAPVTTGIVPINVSGKVTDEADQPLPGVNILVKGTTIGIVTDVDGNYSITVPNENDILIFSYIGYTTQEIQVNGRTSINVSLVEDVQSLDEIVVVGYGEQKKSDLTGSVIRADIESFRESPNVSIMQSLQGSVAGLNVGQINQAGGEPNMQIRGRTSLSGEQRPLIVLDGVIYRGNLNDINPNDIESVDVLKDASAAAIYGSQASNGVIILTTKRGREYGKPVISYSNSFTFQKPIKELRPGTVDDFLMKTEESDIYNSRTEESGYIDKNTNWEPSSNFKTSDEIAAYNQGRSDDWYDLMTNDDPYIQNHNLSLANSSEWSNYYISLGYTDQTGHLVNEGYERINARINLEAKAREWLTFGLQSAVTKSNYLGLTPSLGHRYLSPFATARDENGDLVQITGGNTINPLIQLQSDFVDGRLNLFGNLFTKIDFPFLEGLSYKGNFLNNYWNNSDYYFREYASNFQGGGAKRLELNYNWSSDHILSYKKTFNNIHNLYVTLLYGAESRHSEFTEASASIFANPVLGYNSLQSGSADQQRVNTGAWDETSLYQMARVYYGFNYKYLFTGTIRRDGFSGFGTSNKFGLFPSLSVAWVASEEPFIAHNFNWLNNLKLRLSYGSNGNRTVGRYQTLATVLGGYNYIKANGTPVYTQAIDKLASPNLKWETTTGINVGLDFGIIENRISGSIDYYNNDTKDLLYQVDIPGISRFETFPDNLGRIHNQGIEIAVSTSNIRSEFLNWETSFVFARNRNELRELLGFDIDGDGKEDDLVSEGLFIGQPLDAVFDYSINGIWQVDDDIPVYSDLGAFRVVDINGDGTIDPNDRSIIGFTEPAYRFSINNTITFKNWSFRFFINSIQGGKDRFLGEDNLNSWGTVNSENHFNRPFPLGLDYWTPENPDARYERPNINISQGIAGTRYMPRSFVRLQDVSLAYNLPADVLKKIQVRKLKVFVSGKNLLTLTKWPGWDPETGQNISPGGRPVLKGYSAGINLEF